MKTLTLTTEQHNNDTVVSNVFLDRYMGDSNGEFVKVYLYLLRSISSANIGLSYIADRLNLTEKDVIRALRYWDKQGVLRVSFNSSDEPESIVIVNLNEEVDSKCEQAATITPAPTVEPEVNTGIPAKTKYSPAQAKRLKDQEEVKELLFIVEQYLCKQLTASDISTILYIHNDLGFSTDLLEYLVEYCVTNQHTSMSYIEKVALSWYEKGYTTVAEAKSSSAIFNKHTAIVSRTFGLTNHTLTPVELDFINRWYDEYGFDSDIIEEACKRTILTLSKPNYSYADGILKKWNTAGVRKLEDLKKVDEGFRASITIPVGTKPAPSKTVNKFNSFSQRSYDFDKMEKSLISNNR